jgi:hypothetical protein
MIIETPAVISHTSQTTIKDVSLKVGNHHSIQGSAGMHEFNTISSGQQTLIRFTKNATAVIAGPSLIQVELTPVIEFNILDHNLANYVEVNYDAVGHFKMLMSNRH